MAKQRKRYFYTPDITKDRKNNTPTENGTQGRYFVWMGTTDTLKNLRTLFSRRREALGDLIVDDLGADIPQKKPATGQPDSPSLITRPRL